MDNFLYLTVLVSIVLGLGITRALSGVTQLVHSRHIIKISWIPLCWTASILIWLVGFWWFTFYLSSVNWGIALLFFVLVYSSGLFFLLALLYPEPIVEGFDSLVHFLDSRKWFFGTLFAVALVDIADTWIMHLYEQPLGGLDMVGYIFLMSMWTVMSGIAIFVTNRLYHTFFAVIFFVAMVLWHITTFSLG